MNVTCNDRERIFLDGTAEEWAALETHAAACAACGDEVRRWKDLSAAAADLHREWESPSLWPRIEQALLEQSAASQRRGRFFGSWNLSSLLWQTAAALVLIALTAGVFVFVMDRDDHGRFAGSLLPDPAVREVERAEAAYERAIDKLDAQTRPQLENASTPLMASYREKLLVLDGAISDLKSQAVGNPGNGHLRRQLLAMYREKQDTLEQVLEAKQ
jgi:anti-sigma-K factor RskA